MEYFLYRHIRLDKNEPFYIGIGKKPKNYYGYNTEFKRAFYAGSKRGGFWKQITSKTEYKVEIMMESSNLDYIKSQEVFFITLYGRKDRKEGSLVNMTDGGDFNNAGASSHRKNFKHSEETKRKLSDSHKGRKASLETREYLSEMRKDPYYHKHLLTPEAIEKAKIARRNNLPRVKDLHTGIIHNSLPDACEILGTKLSSEHNRIRRGSKTMRFSYLQNKI